MIMSLNLFFAFNLSVIETLNEALAFIVGNITLYGPASTPIKPVFKTKILNLKSRD